MKLTNTVKKEIVTAMTECKTWEELKKVYLKYAKECKSKTAKEFLDTNFEIVAEVVKTQHVAKSTGKAYTKEPEMEPADFRALIEKLLPLEDVTIEICGTWIYVSGNTKENKEELKSCGFFWCSKKKVWAKAPEGTKRKYRKNTWSMDQVRSAYGSQVVEDAEEIA